MSEATEQEAFVEWCDYNRIPVYAIPNGGKRNVKEAVSLKRQGVKRGVPDLCIPLPAGEYHGCYIEMKYGKNKTTPEQDQWLTLLSKNGYACFVCYGCKAAIDCLKSYLGKGIKVKKWSN